MKPFLILQLRAHDLAADGELEAFVRYGGLTDNQVRRIRMESEDLPVIDLEDYSAVIVGGGPWNVSDPQEKKTDVQLEAEAWLSGILDQIVERDFPYLGACYGLGLLAQRNGALVSKEQYSEGVEALTINLRPEAQADPLLAGLPQDFRAFAGHKEACQELPTGAVWLASSVNCPYHMIRLGQNVYATQFHPELDAQGICDRIDVYKNAGYFPPEEAETLKASAHKENLTVPTEILKRFVERYKLKTPA